MVVPMRLWHWLTGQVWPNLFASAITFALALLAHTRAMRKVREEAREHASTIHDRLDRWLVEVTDDEEVAGDEPGPDPTR